MKLAMSVGNNRHYGIDEIVRRHILQIGEAAGLPKALVHEC
jgi:serine/threonine-protein kinase HipA